jgi:hypothetical protein
MISSPAEQPPVEAPVPMSRLLASCAAAAAVCTPPGPAEEAGSGQETTSTRVPIGAKSQSV